MKKISPNYEINQFYHNVPEWNKPILKDRIREDTIFNRFKKWLNHYGYYYIITFVVGSALFIAILTIVINILYI